MLMDTKKRMRLQLEKFTGGEQFRVEILVDVEHFSEEGDALCLEGMDRVGIQGIGKDSGIVFSDGFGLQALEFGEGGDQSVKGSRDVLIFNRCNPVFMQVHGIFQRHMIWKTGNGTAIGT